MPDNNEFKKLSIENIEFAPIMKELERINYLNKFYFLTFSSGNSFSHDFENQYYIPSANYFPENLWKIIEKILIKNKWYNLFLR